jgi:hypothetical protein
VYRAEIPHYFRHAFSEGRQSVAPRVEYASGLDGTDPKCVVSIIACTSDWTGNWDASQDPQTDRFISADLSKGRMVDIIERGEPACMLAHWTGIHHNGTERGFRAFQEVVHRLHARYDNLLWMKVSEISRYWAARELTAMDVRGKRAMFHAPFACPAFTVRLNGALPAAPLREVQGLLKLESGTWTRDGKSSVVCFDLPNGASTMELLV